MYVCLQLQCLFLILVLEGGNVLRWKLSPSDFGLKHGENLGI